MENCRLDSRPRFKPRAFRLLTPTRERQIRQNGSCLDLLEFGRRPGFEEIRKPTYDTQLNPTENYIPDYQI